MEKKFKHFEQILVKDVPDDPWVGAFFSHFDKDGVPITTSGCTWEYIIPYEGHESLIGRVCQINEGYNGTPGKTNEVYSPRKGDLYYYPSYSKIDNEFILNCAEWNNEVCDQIREDRGWCCRTKWEGRVLCDKLNEAIKNVK